MKIPFTLLSLLFSCIYSYSQDTIDVVDKTIKVDGLDDITEYYGFAAGDKVIYDLTVENGKQLKDVTLSEYPNSIKFAGHETSKIQGKVLNILRNCVYIMQYSNTNISGRTVHIVIRRVPKSEATKFFNTNVKWVNRIDTIYTAKENTYLAGADTSFVDVMDSKVRVHSISNLDNPNKTVVDFILPANTVKWTYWIGVGNEGQEAFAADKESFISSGAKFVGSMNPLVGFAMGLLSLSHAPAGDNVFYYFLPTLEDAQKFNAGSEFMQFKKGDVVNDFGLMNFGTSSNERCYIGLVNDNQLNGINVNVKIMAVVVSKRYRKSIDKVPTYSNKRIPVNEE